MHYSRRLPGKHGTVQRTGESRGDDLGPMHLGPAQTAEIMALHIGAAQDANKFSAGTRGPGKGAPIPAAPGEF
ncbi:hypothetical protein [Actinomyces ruminis]|uniref:hypothetical protein n=1 Tax=Actinomyces ruminis TaxID=1937003 RepID=UPI00211DF100|nr:hypothetical protein [Actinomyces ruminis]